MAHVDYDPDDPYRFPRVEKKSVKVEGVRQDPMLDFERYQLQGRQQLESTAYIEPEEYRRLYTDELERRDPEAADKRHQRARLIVDAYGNDEDQKWGFFNNFRVYRAEKHGPRKSPLIDELDRQIAAGYPGLVDQVNYEVQRRGKRKIKQVKKKLEF